jgi:hypothetical protein
MKKIELIRSSKFDCIIRNEFVNEFIRYSKYENMISFAEATVA